MTTFILKTSSGAPVMSFDSLHRAREAQETKQRHFRKPLQIVRRRIVEELVG